jgi:hypothetical protein
MKYKAVPFVLAAVLLAAPIATAQPLPCAHAYEASAEELISSLRVAEMPGGSAAVGELFVRLSIFAVNGGSSGVALGFLQFTENIINNDLRRNRIDQVTADSLKALIEQARAVLANCTSTPPLLTLNCRSGDGENELMWLTPSGTHSATTILYRTDTYPRGPADPLAIPVGTYPGGPDEVGRATHDTLANDIRYYYAAFAKDASGEASPGKLTFGRPRSRAGAFRWSYTAGGVASPSVGGLPNDFMTVSSAGFVFALEHAADGGFWSSGFTPAQVPSPTAARPISLPDWATPTGEPWVLISSSTGRVSAVHASTGAIVWTSPSLGRPVEASVCAMYTTIGGIDDIVMVGTADGRRSNRFYGLDLNDGSILWSFDNGGGADRIGAIRGMCTVDYGRSQVYFTSKPARFGSQDTVWALSLDVGSATKLWSENHPNVNTSVVRSGDTI